MFTEEFCQAFVDELENFEQSDMPKGRPNTMNNYGVGLISCPSSGAVFPVLSSSLLTPPAPKCFTFYMVQFEPPWSDRAEGMLQGQKKSGNAGEEEGVGISEETAPCA